MRIFCYGLAFMASAAGACDCPMSLNPSEEYLAEEFENASVVFVGLPISLEKHDGMDVLVFEVREALKGVESNFITVTTQDTNEVGSCGFNFELNHPYFVYGYQPPHGDIFTTHCSYTQSSIPEPSVLTVTRKMALGEK